MILVLRDVSETVYVINNNCVLTVQIYLFWKWIFVWVYGNDRVSNRKQFIVFNFDS